MQDRCQENSMKREVSDLEVSQYNLTSAHRPYIPPCFKILIIPGVLCDLWLTVFFVFSENCLAT